MSRIASVAIGLVVLACGACAPHASTSTDPSPPLNAVVLDLLTMSGAYPARKHVLAVAEEQLVERCMTMRGQTYQPFVPPLIAGTDEERIVNLPSRRTEGYGLAPGQSRPPRAAPNADQPEYRRALFGDDQHRHGLRLPNGALHSYPTTGCVAESRVALYGDTVSWARTVSIPQIFDNDIRARVKNAPELAQANAQWASCMAMAGYHYLAPEAATSDVSAAYQQHGPSPDLRSREISTAVTDGECALRAHVPSTELRLRRAKAQSLPTDQRRELTELVTLHCRAYHNALQVIPGNAANC